MAKERKIQKVYEMPGFGFSVVLHNVPMTKIQGEWTPDVDYNHLNEMVLSAVIAKPARLTGAEIKFIRHSLEMTLVEFAERFDVTHPAVLKWEKKKDEPTGISWPTEKDIRLFVMGRLHKKGQEIARAYFGFEKAFPEGNKAIKIDLEKKSA